MEKSGATDRDLNLEAEAGAFDQRIADRTAAGFIPDLRRAVKCDFFYKSFWRDPQFIRLYLGWIVDGYLDLLKTHCGQHLRILDVGCGAGYVSLELARNGHHVTAIDISQKCIATANQILSENPYQDGFGSLEYRLSPFHEVTGTYDVVLFSMSLHHMLDVDDVVSKTRQLLKPEGWFLCYEPCHDAFGEKDAAQVALIRTLLSLTGHWYDADEVGNAWRDKAAFAEYVRFVQTEYVEERDPSEGGQSPNDLEADGAEILESLDRFFERVVHKSGHSFIYRLLGGIRGDDETVRNLADFIAVYDRVSVEKYGQNPNHFFYLGRPRV